MMHGWADDDGGGLLSELCDGDGGGDAVLAADGAELPAAAPVGLQQQQPTLMEASKMAQHDITALHVKLTSIFQGIIAASKLEPKHAELFFNDVTRSKQNKYQSRGTCMACGKAVASMSSARYLGHLLRCPLLPAEIRKAFKSLKQVADDKASCKREAEVHAGEEAAHFAKKHAAEQTVLKQTGIKVGLLGAEKAWADKCIAEFFYANAIPFNSATSDPEGLYQRMVAAIKETPSGYKPPMRRTGRDWAATSLTSATRACGNQLKNAIPPARGHTSLAPPT